MQCMVMFIAKPFLNSTDGHDHSCALGAAFETRHHASLVTFPRSLAEFFADRAKALLDTELDCPSVAAVQAMVVLSSHEIGSNKDSRGWLLCGKSSMVLVACCGLNSDIAGIRYGDASCS